MSFLDKIKKEADSTEAVKPKKTLSFAGIAAAKKNPFGPLDKSEDESLVEAKEEVVQEEKPKEKVLNLVKEEPKQEEVEVVQESLIPEEVAPQDEVKVEKEAETESEEQNALEAEAKEAAKEEIEIKEEPVPVEEVKEEAKAEPKKEAEPVAEEKPKRRRAAPKKKAEEVVDQATPVVIPTTDMGFDEAIGIINSKFVCEQWEAYRSEIDAELSQIVVPADCNPADIAVILADLDTLRQKVLIPFIDTKTLYENISAKEPEGLIEQVKKVSFTEADKNDAERRRSGILACMSYIPPTSDKPMNIYELLYETRSRYNFLKAVMDSIQYKSNVLITMSASLKLESEHMKAQA